MKKKSYPINGYRTQIFEKYNARNERMKTFFPLRHRLKSSISHIFASNISFHVLPLFLVARFSILSSSQACLLSLFSCKVYCLLSATKNEQRFFYSKFHIISLLDFSPTFAPLSYSEKNVSLSRKILIIQNNFFGAI